MGATYTRQSSYADGDTITAAHTNDEFNQLLAAFQASSGHTHDGTDNEGGPITTLLGTALTFGNATADTDIVVTFDGEERDGVLRWIGHDASGSEDDHFRFDDDVMLNSTEKLYFQDTGTYIFSNADGDLDLVADGTNVDAIKLASSGGITLDAAGDIVLDADGDDVTLKNGSAIYGSFTNSSGELVIKSGSSPTTAMTFSGANVTIAGDLTISGDDLTMGTNTSGHIMVADGTNFNPVAVSGDVTIASNGAVTIASSAVENSMLAGSIVDTKLNTISTAGKVALSALEIDGGTDIGAALVDADLIVVDDGAGGTNRKAAMSRVATYIESGISGDITISSGTAAIGSGVIVNADINSSAAIADSKLATISTADKVSGAAIQIDGATDGTSITIADSDKFLIDDGGTTKYVNASQINAYTSAAVALDDISTGDAAVTLATSSGNITIDAQANNTDIIFKGTDATSDITMLTLDGSEAGDATFNSSVTIGSLLKMPDNTSAKILVADGTSFQEVAVSGDVTIANTGAVTIASGAVENAMLAGSIANAKLSNSSVSYGGVELALGASDATPAFDLADATNYPTSSLSGTITNAQLAGSIAASKLAGSIGDSKLSQITTAGKVALGALEIDGASDIGADLADADLIIVDDGAGGTEVKSELTRVKKYIYSAMSGDATASDAGAVTIANGAVETVMLANDAVDADKLASNAVVNASVASGAAIDATKIHDGSISNTEFGYLNNVSSNIQTQLDAKTTATLAAAEATALAIALG